MTKVLVIGAGSIGTRHIRNLIKLGIKEIVVFRTRRGFNKALPDDISQKVNEVYDIKEAFDSGANYLIISNPTNLHLEMVLKGIDKGMKIMVEKPFIHNYALIQSDKDLQKKLLNTNGIVAYNLRFHKLVQELKRIIKDNLYGKALRANLFVGHYLPFWHPYEDYSNSYAARKEQGGGVLRTLSHEIDLAQYLFGNLKSSYAILGKVSDLNINVEDSVDICLQNLSGMYVMLHLNFLYPKIKRGGEILFQNGLLEYDLINSKIFFTDYASCIKSLIYSGPKKFDHTYISQLDSFLKNDNSIACDFQNGLLVDKIIMECELNNRSGEHV